MNLPEGYLLQAKKYRLTKTIGQGGFGITYLGVWNTEVKGELGAMKTRIPVCIKEYFFKDYCYRDNNTQAVKVHSITGEKLFSKFKEKLIEEANILSAVSHPNIVNVLEVFEENSTAYIVMEYIKGNPLKYLLDNEGALPEYKVIKYAHQIGNALSFVHDKNIVHLDIKPGNILVDQDDNARLIDFGVSKRYDIEEQETSTTTLTLSKGFAAIEQYDNEGMSNFSPAPDIYSLGATMYNLLTGIVPIESILRATKQLVPPSFYNSNISSKTEKAILKAMEIKPENRFRTVNEFLVAIDAPIYDFSGNNPAGVNTEIDGDQVDASMTSSHSAISDDEQTIVKSTTTTHHHRKRKRRRRRTKRRIAMIASILLIAFLGYAIYDYFNGSTIRYGVSHGIALINNLLPNKTIENQPDSAIPTEHEEPVADTETPDPSDQLNPIEQPIADPQPHTTATNTVLVNSNTKNANLSNNNETGTATPILTPAQKTSYEKKYNDLVQDGLTKMSNGALEGALIDFKGAADVAKLLEKSLLEINRHIDVCNEKMKEQERNARLAKYEKIEMFGELYYVRRIDNKKFGCIDADGEEIIPCIYVNSVQMPNGNRSFFKDDGTSDIWDKFGGSRSSNQPPR